jgi:hypothetical protein
MKLAHGDMAVALKKSRRSVVTYLEELREQQICSIEVARNQHVAGHIEVCNPFWPYVKGRVGQEGGGTLTSYVEAIRQLLAARKCVKPAFNPADERLAEQLFHEDVELEQIAHAILLASARRYVALLNGTVIGLVAGLSYFRTAILEVRSLQTSEGYWRHLAQRVAEFEQRWAEGQVNRSIFSRLPPT